MIIAFNAQRLGRSRCLARFVAPEDAVVFAVDIPNNNRISNNWRRYQLSIDELETRTSMDFFELLPDGLENVIEAQNVEAPRF